MPINFEIIYLSILFIYLKGFRKTNGCRIFERSHKKGWRHLPTKLCLPKHLFSPLRVFWTNRHQRLCFFIFLYFMMFYSNRIMLNTSAQIVYYASFPLCEIASNDVISRVADQSEIKSQVMYACDLQS